MNYIVFDMEWNQPYPGDRLIYRNEHCLSNEIIQIGAVKLDEKCVITDTFTVNIKPTVFKKLNYNVKKLTGIEQSVLDLSETIDTAIEHFKKWCGTDFVFIAWGYDDIGVLGNNLKYFDIDTSWLPECYNLQMIFCSQTDNENRQYSLSYAIEYFNIIQDKPFHNALTDAYYTALVCSKLDIEAGITKYRAMVFKDKSIPEHMKNIIYKRNHTATDSYEKIINKCGLSSPMCYECGEKLESLKKANNGVFHHLVMGKCRKHGEFALLYKIYKNNESAFNAVEQCFAVDKYNKPYFKAKAKKMLTADAKRKAPFKKKRLLFGKTAKENTSVHVGNTDVRVKQT